MTGLLPLSLLALSLGGLSLSSASLPLWQLAVCLLFSLLCLRLPKSGALPGILSLATAALAIVQAALPQRDIAFPIALLALCAATLLPGYAPHKRLSPLIALLWLSGFIAYALATKHSSPLGLMLQEAMLVSVLCGAAIPLLAQKPEPRGVPAPVALLPLLLHLALQ